MLEAPGSSTAKGADYPQTDSLGRLEEVIFHIRENGDCKVGLDRSRDVPAETMKVLSPGESFFVAERYIDADSKRGALHYLSASGEIRVYPSVTKVTPTAPVGV